MIKQISSLIANIMFGILLAIDCTGQVDVDQKSNTPISIQLGVLPMYYSLVPISFDVLGIGNYDSDVIVDGNNISFDMEIGYFNIHPSDSYTKASITVYNSDSSLILAEQKLIGVLPPIHCSLGGKRSGEVIDIQDILDGQWNATIENFDINIEFDLKSFTLVLVANGTVKSFDVIIPECWYSSDFLECDFFPQEVSAELKKVKGSSVAIFKDMTLIIADDVETIIGPIVFILEGE